jgi:protein kinase C substrate 80K-H
MSLFRGPSAALLALIALLPCLCACSSIRGLDPALAARYEPDASGNFACLDGKKTIPFEQVRTNVMNGWDIDPAAAALPATAPLLVCCTSAGQRRLLRLPGWQR